MVDNSLFHIAYARNKKPWKIMYYLSNKIHFGKSNIPILYIDNAWPNEQMNPFLCV